MSGSLQSPSAAGGFLAPFNGALYSPMNQIIDPRTGKPIVQGSPVPAGLPPQATQGPASQTTAGPPVQLDGFGPSIPDMPMGVGGQDMPAGGTGAPVPGSGGFTAPSGLDNPGVGGPAPGPMGTGPMDYVGSSGLPAAAQGLGPAAPKPAPVATPPDSAGQRGDTTMNGTPAATGLDQSRLDGLWTKITGGESGGSSDPTHAKNPNSSAYGKAQFIDSTRDAFLASPDAKAAGYTVDDFKNKPEVQRAAFDWNTKTNNLALSQFAQGGVVPDGALEAAHALGAGGVLALMHKPDANALQAYSEGTGGDAMKNLITNNRPWNITKDDTAAQALHKIAGYYDSKGKPAASAAGPQAAPSGDPGAPPSAPAAPAAASPIAPTTPNAPPGPPDALAGYSPVQPSDKLLAAASGILQGGPGMAGLTRGLGLGIDKAQQLGITDQNNRYKIMNEAANTQLLKQRLGLVQAQTDAVAPGVAIKQQLADARTAGAGAAQQNADTHTAALDVQKGRLELANQNLQATLTGSKAFGGAVGKDSEKTANQMYTDTSAAAADLQQIGDLRQVIGDNPNAVGGNYQAKVARFLADKFGLDVGVNPDANSVAKKLVANFANQNALGSGKGIGGRITQQEFGQFKDASVNLETRPEAWKAMLDTYEAAAQRRLLIANEFSDLRKDPNAFQSTLNAPGGLGGWYQDKLRGQNTARGIAPQGPAASQYETPPGGGIIHSGGGSNGVPKYTVTPM